MSTNYKYKGDLVAFFLSSPLTKEPEYEIRIKGNVRSIQEYRDQLRQKGILYRVMGLPVFPPPICLILEDKSVKDALIALQTWHRNLTGIAKESVEISIMDPSGALKEIHDEKDIENSIKLVGSKPQLTLD